MQSSYGFDAWGRLTSATAGSQQVSYVNDALGRTISRTQGTQTTALTYQGVGETLVREVGASTIDYAQSPQGPLAQRVGSDVSFFIKNPHGDVVGTAASANLSSSLAYSPYGEVLGSPGSTFGYQGQRTDAATGLVDMTTRHYDPTMGRFISQDVLFGDLNSPMSLNQYAYAAGNPVTMWDPWGLRYCDALHPCQAENDGQWCRPWPHCADVYETLDFKDYAEVREYAQFTGQGGPNSYYRPDPPKPPLAYLALRLERAFMDLQSTNDIQDFNDQPNWADLMGKYYGPGGALAAAGIQDALFGTGAGESSTAFESPGPVNTRAPSVGPPSVSPSPQWPSETTGPRELQICYSYARVNGGALGSEQWKEDVGACMSAAYHHWMPNEGWRSDF